MSRWGIVFATVLIGILWCSGLAQNPTAPLPRNQSGRVPATRKNRQEPCWQVAGISRTTMEQERAVRQQARQQIEAVCANSALSMMQKREQIRGIRMKEKQQIEGLISPAQQQSLRTCRQERGIGGHLGEGGRGVGPCGEMPSGKKPEHETEPED